MFVGTCRISFLLPGNRSLKGKRQVVRRVCDRLRHKFHAAAAEVGDPERWSEAEVGFAVVSANETQARAMAENIIGYVEDLMVAPIDDVELELFAFDDLVGDGSYGEVERWEGAGAAKFGVNEEKG